MQTDGLLKHLTDASLLEHEVMQQCVLQQHRKCKDRMPSDEPQEGAFPLPFLPSTCSYGCSPAAQGRSRKMGPSHPGHGASPAPCRGPWPSLLGKEVNPAWIANLGWADEPLQPNPDLFVASCTSPHLQLPQGQIPPDLPPCPSSLTCYVFTC